MMEAMNDSFVCDDGRRNICSTDDATTAGVDEYDVHNNHSSERHEVS